MENQRDINMFGEETDRVGLVDNGMTPKLRFRGVAYQRPPVKCGFADLRTCGFSNV